MLKGVKIGFCITGSFCTFESTLEIVKSLVMEKADVTAIISETVCDTDTRFNKADEFKNDLERITGKKPICTLTGAEPTGPKKLYDIVVVAPCTGNTTAKIASGISDTSVTLAVKAHLRNNRPVVLGLSTNDALGANAKNIGTLLNAKHIYFVPFFQDDPIEKEKSLLFKEDLIIPTIQKALENKQLQPLLH